MKTGRKGKPFKEKGSIDQKTLLILPTATWAGCPLFPLRINQEKEHPPRQCQSSYRWLPSGIASDRSEHHQRAEPPNLPARAAGKGGGLRYLFLLVAQWRRHRDVCVPHRVQCPHHLPVERHCDGHLAHHARRPGPRTLVQRGCAALGRHLPQAVQGPPVPARVQPLHPRFHHVHRVEEQNAGQPRKGPRRGRAGRGRSVLGGDQVKQPEARGLGGGHLKDRRGQAPVAAGEAVLGHDRAHTVEEAVEPRLLRPELVVDELHLDRLLGGGHKDGLQHPCPETSEEPLEGAQRVGQHAVNLFKPHEPHASLWPSGIDHTGKAPVHS
mmetsp:Transcript_41106/g.67362  ORF Transcript_41106/g.67362 Transcript_41106/m.67362 type:complete len:325 (-) Transcript_41106:289-1263(-)